MAGDNIERGGGSFAVFALPSVSGEIGLEADIDEYGKQIRRRRKHVKSRAGCASCKERKIKCDEQIPSCKNCTSRQLICNYVTQGSRTGSQSSLSGIRESPQANEDVARPPISQALNQRWAKINHLPPEGADMQPMDLLHQFETYTSETMMFGGKIWKLRVIPLALKNNYLLHAILLITCSHLRYMHPDEPIYRRLEAQHLSHTLEDFRKRLSEPISETNVDILAACGLTLLHHAWSVTDSLEEMDIGADNLFALSAGPPSVIQHMLQIHHKSVFADILCPDYAGRLTKWINSFKATYDLEKLFTYRAREEQEYPHTDTVQSLIPILRVYELQLSGVDLSDVRIHYYVSRYIFNWPAKISNNFIAHVQSKDPEALLILLCFYTISPRLLDTAWWIRNRSKYMRQAICKLFQTQSREWNVRLEILCNFLDRRSDDGGWSWSGKGVIGHGDPSQLDSEVASEMEIFTWCSQPVARE